MINKNIIKNVNSSIYKIEIKVKHLAKIIRDYLILIYCYLYIRKCEFNIYNYK